MFMATIKIGTKTSNRINIKFMIITLKPQPLSRNIRENEEGASSSTDGDLIGCGMLCEMS